MLVVLVVTVRIRRLEVLHLTQDASKSPDIKRKEKKGNNNINIVVSIF